MSLSSQQDDRGRVTLYIPIEAEGPYFQEASSLLLEMLRDVAEGFGIERPEIALPDLSLSFPSIAQAADSALRIQQLYSDQFSSDDRLQRVQLIFYIASKDDRPWKPSSQYPSAEIVLGRSAKAELAALGYLISGDFLVGKPRAKVTKTANQSAAEEPRDLPKEEGEAGGVPNLDTSQKETPQPQQQQQQPPPPPEPQPVPDEAAAPPSELLSDEAIRTAEDDVLGLTNIAESISIFIDNAKTKTPVVISINAPWGAGKTSLTNLVAARLGYRNDIERFNHWVKRHDTAGLTSWLAMLPTGSTLWNWGRAIRESREGTSASRHSICKFNAWLYDDSPSLTGTFAREITRRANECRSLTNQIFRAVAIRQTSPAVNVMRIGVYGLAVALFAASPWFEPVAASFRIAAGGLVEKFPAVGPITLAALFPLWEKIKGLTDSLTKFASDPEAVAAKGQIYRVRERLGGLLQQATSGRRKFIIIIDDLERCKPENALAILDLVNQLLTHPNVVVIIAGDMSMIAASAGSKFKDQAKLMIGESDEALACLQYGQRYLQKVVQMQFDLPPPLRTKLVDLTKGQTDEDVTSVKSLSTFVLTAMSWLIQNGSLVFGFFGQVFEKVFVRKAKVSLENIKIEADTIAEGLPLLVLNKEAVRRFRVGGITDEAEMRAAIERANERYANTADAIRYLVENFDLSPRQVKRYENMLRILFWILMSAGVKVREQLPEQLAKWILLQNEWPTFTNKIALQTSLMGEVEALMKSSQAVEILTKNFPRLSNPSKLARTLAHEPPLADAIVTLVNLKPDAVAVPEEVISVKDLPKA